jgi:hypothetical protein
MRLTKVIAVTWKHRCVRARNALIFGATSLVFASLAPTQGAEAAFRCPSGQIYRVTKKICVPKSEALQFLSRAKPKAKPRTQAKTVEPAVNEKPSEVAKPVKPVKPVEAENVAGVPRAELPKPAPAAAQKPAQAYVPDAKPQSAITAPTPPKPQSAITAPPPPKPAPFGQLVPVKPGDD